MFKVFVNFNWLAIDSNKIGTRLGQVFGTKGSVAIALKLKECSILFVNSHFAAHQDNVQERNQDYQKAMSDLKMHGFDKKSDQK
jgi:hypothetical protein